MLKFIRSLFKKDNRGSITITIEDYNNSSKAWWDNRNCPLATAIKRIFNDTEVVAGADYVKLSNGNIIQLDKSFRSSQMYALEKGKEFTSKYTKIINKTNFI